MKKILSIFGTRPEAIKMVPVVKELERHPGRFQNRVCVTAQHRRMLDRERIVSETTRLLTNDHEYRIMSRAHNPYGDGAAAARIADVISTMDGAR